MAKEFLTKRALIDQANTTVVILTSVAAFVFVFCAVATKTLASQAAYQNKIISGKRTAVKQLKTDLGAVSTLKTSYKAFTSTSQNVIGGNTNGTGAQDCSGKGQDGNNAKIVLDALPSSYDFPALTASLEKLMACQQVSITNITGTDEAASQASNTSSATPKAIPMTFSVSAEGSYDKLQGLVSAFEHSIRPVKVTALGLTGNKDKLTLTVTAETYFQPAKSLNISTKVVK